jgi:predicted Rossmann fold nucleotide-binding protein DprA/Smf involved in DNA uptake
VTGRQAIVIPDGDLDTALRAAEKYDARLLILDQNYPQGLEEIYQEPGDYPGLRYLETIADMHIYLMEP